MLGSRWYKIFNDLWSNKTRTLLIILSIAVGLFAVGAISSSRTILSTEMDKSYAAINPSTGVVHTLQPFDEGFIQSVRDMPGVAEVDARRVISARIRLASGRWINITLFAVENYDQMRVNKIWPQSGAWPPPEREILIERAALPVIEAQIGDVALIELPNQQQRELRIAGTVHDLVQMPAQFDNSPYGYVSFDTLEWFGEAYGFNELQIVAVNAVDKASAQEVTNQVKDKAEKSGLIIPLLLTVEPGQLPLDDILQAVLLLLGVLGLLSLFLSAFLIVNTVSALLTQQKRQIGVMKAIGASTGQVIGMYLVMVCIYGLAALALAVPLSILGSQAFSQMMAAMFNFDLADTRTPAQSIVLQVVIGLVVPALSSLYPFLANLRLTAAEAMSTYQAGRGRFGGSLIDRALSGANLWFARRVLMRPLLLSMRNTFRSKGRLTLTLLTLTLGSALFISVFNVQASLITTLDDLLAFWNFDLVASLEYSYRIEKIETKARQTPGVIQTDVWTQLPTRLVRPDGSESGMIYMFATRPDSAIAPAPKIIQGRGLLPGDENALIVSVTLFKDEPQLHLGSQVKLKIDGKEQIWYIVGITPGMLAPMMYANYDYVARITGDTGRANAALVITERHDAAGIRQTGADLEAHLKRAGLRVNNVSAAIDERQEAVATFSIITNLLFVMAILLALVGGLGLMGTMSINVLERTREIGVLRAIGAPSRGVAQVFIREGITIGLLSWAFGSLLALPMSRLLSNAVGIPLMGAPLSFTYSMTGVWLWLALVVMLSALASYLPARSASRLTVREVLAYE